MCSALPMDSVAYLYAGNSGFLCFLIDLRMLYELKGSMKKTYYITTPIYYVTAKPHLGSLYSTVLADVCARYYRMRSRPVFFLTGTDEHGQKIAQAAQKAGKQPREFVDSFVHSYKQVWRDYAISYDAFIRTTDTHHIKAVQEWVRRLEQTGDVYLGMYEGNYCVPCETYATQVLCPSCGRQTQNVQEESYFFKLSAYQDRLLRLYEEHPEFIVPHERMQEVISFVKEGLKDLSISRTAVSWGIPFPGNDRHVVYVWADALNNYISAIGWPDRMHDFERWWPANTQVLGKDIVRFHAVYWPAFLMALEVPIPEQLLVHGWINIAGQKMSKSLGNVVDPQELLRYGADQIRYYMMRYFAITHDADFSLDDLQAKIATDLSNDLGNLANRLLVLAYKNGMYELSPVHVWSPQAVDLRDKLWDMIQAYTSYMENRMVHMALAEVFKYVACVNAYFHACEPWKVIQKDRAAAHDIFSAVAHSLHALAIVLWPVLPNKMEQLFAAFGKQMRHDADMIEFIERDIWTLGFLLKQMPPLFERPVVEQSVQELSVISFDEFTKVELVVGTIVTCEPVAKSDKLYCLSVDFGDLGRKQILSGIRQHVTPEELVGRQGVFVYNLAPRTMLGLESQGMLLCAYDAQGKVQVVTVGAAVPAGTRVK